MISWSVLKDIIFALHCSVLNIVMLSALIVPVLYRLNLNRAACTATCTVPAVSFWRISLIWLNWLTLTPLTFQLFFLQAGCKIYSVKSFNHIAQHLASSVPSITWNNSSKFASPSWICGLLSAFYVLHRPSYLFVGQDALVIDISGICGLGLFWNDCWNYSLLCWVDVFWLFD